jgi:hypothetical protein
MATKTRQLLLERKSELEEELAEIKLALRAISGNGNGSVGLMQPTIPRRASAKARGYNKPSDEALDNVRGIIRGKANFTIPQVEKLSSLGEYGVRAVFAELERLQEIIRNDRVRDPQTKQLGAVTYNWAKKK